MARLWAEPLLGLKRGLKNESENLPELNHGFLIGIAQIE